ncbi:MAG: hypothetical protein WCJ87_03920, partial [Burkholderiales bacterium]
MPRKRLLVEALEQRLLLSAPGPISTVTDVASGLDTSKITGVTVITHGFQPEYVSNGDALLGLGKAIVNFERYQDGNPNNSAWLLDYDVAKEGNPGVFDLSQSSTDLPGLTGAKTGPSGELVLTYDWAVESNEHAPGWTEAAGDGLFSLLSTLKLVDPQHPEASKPLHFIAHSFGAAVTSEAVERLAYYGVPVDQVTLLDPHDFNQGIAGVDTFQGQYTVGQPTGYGATKWSNVSFMDAYFQTRGKNGSAVPSAVVPLGRPIPGAYNRFLDAELPDPATYSPFEASGDHSYVWSTFYASSIPGSLLFNPTTNTFTEQMGGDGTLIDVNGNKNNSNFAGPAAQGSFSSPAEARTPDGTYGFGFSRLAGGQAKRPPPDFYGLGADDIAAHKWTPDALKPLSNADPGQAEPVGGYAPVWRPYASDNGSGVLFNGNFAYAGELPSLDALSDGLSATVPGWTHHGGGGGAQVPLVVGTQALRLSATPDSSQPTLDPKVRVHDDFYLPESASHLRFSLRDLTTAAGAKLQVFLADETLVQADGSFVIPAGRTPLTEISLATALPGGSAAYTIALNEAALRVKLRSGAQFDVVLDGTTTLADVVLDGKKITAGVMNRIEEASRSNPADATTRRVSVRLAASGDRLEMLDLTAGTGVFGVSALNGVAAALPGVGLGLVGDDTNADGLLVGASLLGANVVGASPLTGATLLTVLNGGIGVADVSASRFEPSVTGGTRSLAFRLVDATNTAKVLLDDVQFLSLASARSADVLELNLGTLIAASRPPSELPVSYDIRALGISGAVITQTSADEYAVNARRPDGTAGAPWGRLILSERYDPSSSFADSGRLLFVPFLPDALNTTATDAIAFTGTLELSYAPQASQAQADARRFEYQSDRFISLLNIRNNASLPDAEESIVAGTDALTTLRIQQRLRALGYPGVSGGPLLVDGKLGANTRNAIGLFNAVVGGLNQSLPSDTVDLAWINDPLAPRWGVLADANPSVSNPVSKVSLFAAGNNRWGSSWTQEVLSAAGLLLPADKGSFELAQAAKSSGNGAANGLGQSLVFATRPNSETAPLNKPIAAAPFFDIVPVANKKLIAAANSTDAAQRVLVRNSAGAVVNVAASQATAPGNTLLLADSVLSNRLDLLAIKGLFKYATTYGVATVNAQIKALKDARTVSGAKVAVIYSGDPGTWDGDGTTGIVRFEGGNADRPRRFEEPNLGGTFEVQIAAPTRRPGPQEQAALSGWVTGVQRVFDFIGQLPDWASKVPLIGGVLKDMLPMEELVGKLMRETFGPLAQEANLSLERLRELLSKDKKEFSINVPQSDGTFKLMTYSFGLKPGSALNVSMTDQAIRIDGLELVAERSDPVVLDLGADVANLGLKLTGETKINLKQTWSLKLGLEYQRDPALPLDQAVVIRQLRADAGISFTATGGANDPLINAKLRLGSLDADLIGGRVDQFNISVGAGLSASKLGANGLSLQALAALPLSAVTETVWGARIKAELPIKLDTSIAGTVSQSIFIDDGTPARNALVLGGTPGPIPSLSLTSLVPTLKELRFGGASGISLPELRGIDTSQLLAMLDKLRNWFNTLGGSVGHSGQGSPLQLTWPDIELPQLGTLKWPDLSNFLRLGDWLKLPDLRESNSTFDLPSWQDIVKRIPGFTLDTASFDAINKTLSYSINLDQLLGQWTTRLKLGDGDQTVPAPLTAATALADLNAGGGISDLNSALASLRIQLRSTNAAGVADFFDVALTGLTTLDQVISRIETASRTTANDPASKRVTVRIGPQADRLVIEDRSLQVVKVSALNGLRTGQSLVGLGLVGEDSDGDGSLAGTSLAGPSGAPLTLTANTLLASLNGPAVGVADLADTRASLRVSLRTGTSFDVTLTGATTIQQVIDKIEAASRTVAADPTTKRVTVRIDAAGSRLIIDDKTTPSTFKLSALNGLETFRTLKGLGLLTDAFDATRKFIGTSEDVDGDGAIVGASLTGSDGIAVDASARIKGSFKIGVDFSPIGRGFTLAVPVPLTAATALADLNAGGGIADLNSALASLRVQLRSTNAAGVADFFDVALTGATTLEQVISRIETASRTNANDAATKRVTVRIGPQSDRLVIEDRTAGSGTFSITARNGLKTGIAGPGIGLVAEDVDRDGVIVGASLTGKNLADLNGGAGLVGGAPVAASDPQLTHDIRITLRNGTQVGVNLSGLTTVQQLIDRLNTVTGLKAGISLTSLIPESATSANWNALDQGTLNLKGETARIWLQDLTVRPSGSDQLFKVEAANGSLRGAAYIGLGLLGVDDDGEGGLGDGVIAGATLHGDSIESHIFLSNVGEIKTSVELNVPDIDARLQVAGLGIGVQNGSGQLRAELPIQLRDPGLAQSLRSTDAQSGISTYNVLASSLTDGRITLTELTSALGDSQNLMFYSATEVTSRLKRLVGDLVLKGSASLELPIVTTPAGLLAGVTNPGISVNWTDLSKRDTLRVETRGLNVIDGLRNFASAKLIENLRELQKSLKQVEGQAIFQQDLPLVGKSLAELVGLSDRFGKFVDELEKELAKNPGATVAQLQDAIARVIKTLSSLGSNGGSAPTAASSTTSYGQSLVQLSLNFENKGTTQVPLDLSLGDLGEVAKIAGINGNLISSTGDLTLAWLGALELNLEIDVSSPLSPVVFIRDNSKARFGLGLDEGRFTADATGNLTLVDGLNVNAALGPLGLFVRQGQIRLNDGARILAVDPKNAKQGTVLYDNLAEWTVDVRNETGTGADGRYRLFGDFNTSLLDTTGVGRIDAVLPIKFPTETRALDSNQPNFELHVSDLSKLTSLSALKGLTTSIDPNNRVLIPDFSQAAKGLGALTGDLSNLWNSVGENWTAAFDTLDKLLAEGAFDVQLPLIGGKLSDSLNFVRDLRDALEPVLSGATGARTQDLLKAKVLEALRPWVKDHNGNGIVDGDLNNNGLFDANEDFVMASSADRIEFDLDLYSDKQLVNSDIGFDLGLPGLGLNLDGSVALDLGFTWKFGFGISKADGFYLKLPDAVKDDLTVDLSATLPGFAATGQLGFLRVQATDDVGIPDQPGVPGTPAKPTKLSGKFIVDLKDPSRDQRLTVTDLRSGASIGQYFDARFSGDANLNLDLEASFQGNRSFPRVAADLGIVWTFGTPAAGSTPAVGASTQDPLFGAAPTVTFDNVRFNAGDFINGLFGPLVNNVKKIVDPIKPALDFLTSSLPGISDLLGTPVTLLDVAEKLGAPNVAQVRKFIVQVKYLSDLANSVSNVSGDTWINVGKMTIKDDVRNSIAPGTLSRTETAKTAEEVRAQLATKGAKTLVDNADSEKGGFDFPLFNNPASLFGLLTGNDVTLVTYTTPALNASLPFSTPQFPVLPPVIFGNIFGAVGFDAQFSFGYDTLGVKHYGQTNDPASLLDGFYVGDWDASGRDVPELSVYGELGLRVSLQDWLAPIVQAGASGALRATIDFNLNDPNNDGKVRWDEIARNLDLGPIYLFDTSGSVDFRVQAWFKT